jgi:hypothetical protein
MEQHHGFESYYIEGEGLLDESGEGRPRTLEAAVEAVTPPFRFSRMGPSGANRQLSDANRAKIGLAMTSAPNVESQVPAGFTYLGQFIDHDLTFDKTTVTFGQFVTPAQLVQNRSPSLDLDSLYGAGPADPESAKCVRPSLLGRMCALLILAMSFRLPKSGSRRTKAPSR